MNCKNRIHRTLLCPILIAAVGLWLPAQAQDTSFPLPPLPPTLGQPAERLAYLLQHYWEQYNFDDTSSTNRRCGEQGFVDFINIMPVADSLLCADAAARYVELALATPEGREQFNSNTIHYLGNRLSPLRNDITYAHLLRQAARYYSRTEHKKTHYANLKRTLAMLDNIDKNQVGDTAADFKFKDSKGKRQRLGNIHSKQVLLMFFDPECYDCLLAKQDMETNPLFANPDLSIVRVQPSQAKRLYYITGTPSFYMLDANRRVLLKDATYEQTVDFLEKTADFHAKDVDKSAGDVGR